VTKFIQILKIVLTNLLMMVLVHEIVYNIRVLNRLAVD